MKKITFIMALMSFSLMKAQQVVVQNFETPSSYTFVGFEGLASASIDVDPQVGGTRGNNLKLVSQTTGNPWQGAEVVQQNLALKLTTVKTVSVDVYATQAFTLLGKVELGTGPISAASQNYTTPNTWQTLTFTFTQSLDGTGVANGNYQKIVFFPNWKATNDGFNPPANFTVYVDNITSEAVSITPPAQPATAAPTPPARPAADVKSIFSNAYTPLSAIGYTGDDNTYNNSWCGANTTLLQIEGNDTHKITGLGCEGITFLAGRFDATSFTHFHIDIWTETATLDKVYNVKFSNWNGGAGEANAIEYSINNSNFLTNPNPGTWISVDVPLTDFLPINGSGRNDIVQFVVTSDLGTVFYDNLYLHKNTVLDVANHKVVTAKLFPNPATNILNIQANSVIESVSIFNVLGQEVVSIKGSEELVSVDVSSFNSGIYVVKTMIEGKVSTSKFIKE